MKNQTVKALIVTALIAAVSTVTTLTAGAADQKPDSNPKKSDPAPKSVSTKSVSSLPFHGKLGSVDQTTKSIKVGERTFQVMTTTKITKDGATPGTLDDAKIGESVAGSFHEGDGGQYQLVSLRLGPKAGNKPAADKKK